MSSGNGVPAFSGSHCLSPLRFLCIDVRGVFCIECKCQYYRNDCVRRHIREKHKKSLLDLGFKENSQLVLQPYLDERLVEIKNSNDHRPYIDLSSEQEMSETKDKWYCPDCDTAFKNKKLCTQHYKNKKSNCDKSNQKMIKCLILHSGHPYPKNKLRFPDTEIPSSLPPPPAAPPAVVRAQAVPPVPNDLAHPEEDAFKADDNFDSKPRGFLRSPELIDDKDGDDDLFEPKNDHCSKMLTLLQTEERADASFTVGGKCFKVHSLIINAQSPILANNINGSIDAVHPYAFQLLLEYIYSGRVPTDQQILKHGKDLIDVANRFEFSGLKMFVENGLVRKRIMTKENVADYILFAHAQSCALLKEHAISFFLVHQREVLQSGHSKCLRDSAKLLSEIKLLDSEGMSVNELRKELSKRKLDVDGSKDALVARLKEAKRRRTE